MRGLTPAIPTGLSSLIRMAQEPPGLTSSKHVDGARRDSQLLCPFLACTTPPIRILVPVVQDGDRLLLGKLRVRGVFALQPALLTVPAVGPLDRSRELLTGVPQTVVTDLIDRVIWVPPGDLCVGMSFLSKVAPCDYQRDCGFCHSEYFVSFLAGLRLNCVITHSTINP